MARPPLLLTLALGAALAGFALGACGNGDSGAGPANDGGLTEFSCLDIRDCVKASCPATLAGADADACVKGCLDKASAAAQQGYRNLVACLVNTCCTEEGGCGGGDPRCSTNGAAACESCTCKAQCASEGARCRLAAKICFGTEPNCSTCG